MIQTPHLDLLVHGLKRETEKIMSLDLRPQDGSKLPEFTAGSHIDLHLRNGMSRSYSLVNSTSERHRYVVAVLLDANSRGGSRFIHENVTANSIVKCGVPRNNFPLHEDAETSVFIAGGIGVTPVLSMIDRLLMIGRSPEVIYCAKSRPEAAFQERLLAERPNSLLHFDDERSGPPDLRALLAKYPSDAHFYCCGPHAMLDAFTRACQVNGFKNAHLERFSPVESANATPTSAYEVKLAKSNLTLFVPEGKPLIEALEDAGMEVAYSCREGVCGICETRVLSGTPDHRDSVLS